MDKRLGDITTERLTPLARRALRDSAAVIRSWARAPVYGGFGGAVGGTALFRFEGQTAAHRPWSVILKILYQRSQENPSSPYYWKREYEVYRSGMLDGLPPNTFAAPRIYGLEDFGDACWIWMEDLGGGKPNWSLADYREMAVRLGRLNGAYLARLPAYEWLTDNWHCAIVEGLTDAFARLDDWLEEPLARRCLPMDAKAEIEWIWSNRARYCRALADLPRTLCHIDAFRRNLLHRQDDIALIDWAVAGRGGLGEDLVALVAVSLYYGRFSRRYAEQLDREVFAGYVKGLRESGWDGEAKLARLGYVCGMTLRGLAGVAQDIKLLMNEDNHQWLMRNHQCSDIGETADFFADVRRFRLLKMAREVQELV